MKEYLGILKLLYKVFMVTNILKLWNVGGEKKIVLAIISVVKGFENITVIFEVKYF